MSARRLPPRPARRLTHGSPGARRGARRGAVLPLVCVLLTALLGAAALAVDLGRLYHVAAEVQTAADAAALAAVSASQRTPGTDSYDAPARAQAVAQRNRANGAAVTVASADVIPAFYDPAARALYQSSWSGSVTAVHVTARAQVPWMLARVFGLAPVSISRRAAAWIASVNGAACVRPFTLPYTRNYEHGIQRGRDSVYTKNWFTGGGSPYAPEYTQGAVASLQVTTPNLPQTRTYMMLPPWQDEDTWELDNNDPNLAHRNTGTWKPADFTGGGSPSDYITFLSTAPGSSPGTSACSRAAAKVGDVLTPLVTRQGSGSNRYDAFLANTATGMAALCNRAGNNTDARCFDGRGDFGVRTRVAFTDSVVSGGTYTLRVREVSQVRVVCYFRTSADICPATPYKDGHGVTSPWRLSGTDRGYPAGSIAVVLDGPASMDMTPDVIMGGKVGITQRLLLVR